MGTYQWIWQYGDWPHFTFCAERILSLVGSASTKVGALEAICRTLGEQEKNAALERTLADDAVETSAIEGETLRRSSVRNSIRKKLGLSFNQGEKDERTDALVALLFDARLQEIKPLTEERLLGWHAALFPSGYSGLKKIEVGRYRGEDEMQIVSGPFGKEVVHYVAPPRTVLEQEMKTFLEWVNTDDTYPPLLKAGIAHLWFIMIHPFDDGNGRLGRVIVDYILSAQYPELMRVVSFSREFSLERKMYYAELERAGKGDTDITDWLSWFLQTAVKAMEKAEWIVELVLQKALFWQNLSDVQLNDRQQKVLNRLLDVGDDFVGNMTTRKYAGMTKCSKITASRDLADLAKKGVLKSTGGGRSVAYVLCTEKEENAE